MSDYAKRHHLKDILMKSICCLAAFVLTGCVTQAADQAFPIEVTYTDGIDDRSFYVEYQNRRQTAVCLSPENWPNSAGAINFAHKDVWSDIDGSRYYIKKVNTGYCPDCLTSVAPGAKITAQLPYDQFGIPAELYGSKKTLNFAPLGFACKR